MGPGARGQGPGARGQGPGARAMGQGPGARGSQSREIRMVENGRSITGCLIHSVTQYRGYVCVRLSFPVLSFRKEICHHSNSIKLRIIIYTYVAGCSPKGNSATNISQLSVCVMAGDYQGFKTIFAWLLD